MSKNKTIAEQIDELERENLRLSELEKCFDKAVKNEFGYDIKTLHKILEKQKPEARIGANYSEE